MELLAALEGAPPAPDDDPELRRWLSAATWDNIGVATGFLGEHERAISAFERSEEVYRSLGMPDGNDSDGRQPAPGLPRPLLSLRPAWPPLRWR